MYNLTNMREFERKKKRKNRRNTEDCEAVRSAIWELTKINKDSWLWTIMSKDFGVLISTGYIFSKEGSETLIKIIQNVRAYKKHIRDEKLSTRIYVANCHYKSGGASSKETRLLKKHNRI